MFTTSRYIVEALVDRFIAASQIRNDCLRQINRNKVLEPEKQTDLKLKHGRHTSHGTTITNNNNNNSSTNYNGTKNELESIGSLLSNNYLSCSTSSAPKNSISGLRDATMYKERITKLLNHSNPLSSTPSCNHLSRNKITDVEAELINEATKISLKILGVIKSWLRQESFIKDDMTPGVIILLLEFLQGPLLDNDSVPGHVKRVP